MRIALIVLFLSWFVQDAFTQIYELRRDVTEYFEQQDYKRSTYGFANDFTEETRITQWLNPEPGKEYAVAVFVEGCNIPVNIEDLNGAFENLRFEELIPAPKEYMGEKGLPLYYFSKSYSGNLYSERAKFTISVDDSDNVCDLSEFAFQYAFFEKGKSNSKVVDEMLFDMMQGGN